MIRIEGIPVVAARLAATLESAKSIQASRAVRQHRMQPSQRVKAPTTVRVRPLASPPVAA